MAQIILGHRPVIMVVCDHCYETRETLDLAKFMPEGKHEIDYASIDAARKHMRDENWSSAPSSGGRTDMCEYCLEQQRYNYEHLWNWSFLLDNGTIFEHVRAGRGVLLDKADPLYMEPPDPKLTQKDLIEIGEIIKKTYAETKHLSELLSSKERP